MELIIETIELKERMDKDLKEVFNVDNIINFQFDLMQQAYLKCLETRIKIGKETPKET